MGWIDLWNPSARSNHMIIVGVNITGPLQRSLLQRADHHVLVLEPHHAVGQDNRTVVLTAQDAEALEDQGLSG
jgi:2-polyprenyl-6-methoxyphenol hydroxylase-like FAD-dependent oxidoreductase